MKQLQFSLILMLMLSFSTKAQLWKEYADSAKYYTDNKNAVKAFDFYFKINEELKKDSSGTKTFAFYAHELGRLYFNKNQFTEAEICILEAKKIREKLFANNSPVYALSCELLGRLYLRINQLDKAEPLFFEVKKIREIDPGRLTAEFARSCQSLGVLYATLHQPEKAEPFFLEEKEIQYQLNNNSIAYAQSCYNVGHVYLDMKQNEKAETNYLEAKKLMEDLIGKAHPFYAQVCSDLAIIFFKLGQYEKAEQSNIETKEIRAKIHGTKSAEYAASCNNLADLYTEMGQYKKAEPLFLESKDIIIKIHTSEHQEYAQSCNNLGRLNMYMGDYEKAEKFYMEAKAIRERILKKEHPDYTKSFINLGNLYMSLGQYEKAETYLSEAKQIRQSVLSSGDPSYAYSCSNLASLYQARGNFKKAEPLLLEAREILSKNPGKEHPDYAMICDNLGLLLISMGNFELAKSYINESKNILTKMLGKEHPAYAANCNNLAGLYMNLGQYEQAELLYLEAKQTGEKVNGKEHIVMTSYSNNLAKVYWNLNKLDKAGAYFEEAFISRNKLAQKIFKFTSESEKQLYLKNMDDYENDFFSYGLSTSLSSSNALLGNVALAKRNMILSSSQQLLRFLNNTNDTLIKNKYESWLKTKEQLSYWYAKPLIEQMIYVKDLQSRANDLEKELTVLSATFKEEQSENIISWKNVQQNLKQDEVAIEMIEFQYYNGKKYTDSVFYIALLTEKNKAQPEMIKLFEERQLDSILNYKNTSAGQHYLSYLYTHSNNQKNQSLYNLIWKPIEQKLTGIKTIYFAPAGSLHKISFAALSVSKTEVLSDKYHLVQLNTTASVGDNPVANVSASDKIILYGGVQYDADSTTIRKAALKYSANDVATRSLPDDLLRDGVGEFYYLPASENEVTVISKLATVNKYISTISEGMMATEESFKALTGKNSPAVLHIATHGFFFPDPKSNKKDDKMGGAIVFRQSDNPLIRSGLALAGANNAWKGKPVKGVEDGILTSYEVSNMHLPNTKLAVLSACETGLGDIQGSEGVYGLQRAFKMAGVENLIMSLWKVDDAATSEFMLEFYKNLFAKQTINNAFYNAQTIMKNKYRNDPYKWAAWVLIR